MNIKKMFVGDTNSTFIQFFRYCFVGGLAFVVDAGSLALLVEFAGMNEKLAAAVGFVLGLTVNYVLSTFWIFKNSKISNKAAEFLAFAVIGVIGLFMNIAIISLFSDYIGPKQPIKAIPVDKYYMIGKLVSTVNVFVWNFCARKFIIFDKNKE